MNFSDTLDPHAYHAAACLAQEVGTGMLTRLELVKMTPQVVLDVGCGVGVDAGLLAKRYPQAKIIGIDIAEGFLKAAKESAENVEWLQAEGTSIPLPSGSVDIIFANMLLPWHLEPLKLWREWRRLLRPEGLVIFSCLGPDTFHEWRHADHAEFLPYLADMHNVGDSLLREGFADPVLEVENITLTYRSLDQLQQELVDSGMQPGDKILGPIPLQDAVFPVTYEVVYGHAWCPASKGFGADASGVVKIPVSELKKT